jgi:hypothetical protein
MTTPQEQRQELVGCLQGRATISASTLHVVHVAIASEIVAHIQLDFTVPVTFIRAFILLLAAGAIGCSVFTLLSCEFVRLTVASAAQPEITTVGGMGLFSYQAPEDEATCVPYDDLSILENSDWMNEMWTVAQYASLIAPVLGTCAWLLTVGELFWGKFYGSFILPIVLYLFACLAQGEKKQRPSPIKSPPSAWA